MDCITDGGAQKPAQTMQENENGNTKEKVLLFLGSKPLQKKPIPSRQTCVKGSAGRFTV